MTLTQPPRTLLAAVDYSDLASLVLRQAIDQARPIVGGELHFLHVHKDRRDIDPGARRDELLNWLGAELRSANVPETLRIVGHEGHGDPANVIVQAASDLFAELVVLGTHGRTGVQRMVMGSTAETVVRHCGCPVLVVRPTAHEHSLPEIEPPCPRCVAARLSSHGANLWCEQHSERHGRRHTYYDPRSSSWVSARMIA